MQITETEAAKRLGQNNWHKTEFREKADKMFLLMDYIISGGLVHLNGTFWTSIFEPTFGQIDRNQFMTFYFNASGVRLEFERMKASIFCSC